VLEELHVARLGVVEDATLALAPGLNVLSGETGAGKTLITVGLALALGARAASGMVRPGERSSAVEARFRLPEADPDLSPWLDDAEAGQNSESPEVEVILARTVGADGRSSARIGGRLAPASALVATGDGLVEIHGQQQADRLLSKGAQMEFLDRYTGPEHLDAVAGYRARHRELREVRAALAQLEQGERERERERDLLEYQIREIEAANVVPGETASLEQEESRLSHAERILELAATSEHAVGEEGGAADGLRQAAAALEATASLDSQATDLASRAVALVAEADDVLADVRSYRDSVQADPVRLEEVRARIQALKGLERKYGDGEEGILAYLEQARSRLSGLEGQGERRAELEAQLGHLDAQVSALASQVSEGRARSAPRLGSALTAEVQELGMPGAQVEVKVEPIDGLGPDGAERVEFVFAGSPEQPALPLARAASGGELSRVMLACRSVLATLDDVPTLVFDEVDAGIGGRTALAVATRLADLGRSRQVVVVTHLAQIAARADRHFVVTKRAGTASVRTVEGEDRVEELARMLSGTTGEVSLAHARELMAGGDATGATGATGATKGSPGGTSHQAKRAPAATGRRG
jgi:DNA repair protein RecN (Recombination protein N)